LTPGLIHCSPKSGPHVLRSGQLAGRVRYGRACVPRVHRTTMPMPGSLCGCRRRRVSRPDMRRPDNS
jgi:hypothetical protein